LLGAARHEVSSASVELLRVAYGVVGAAAALRFLLRGWVDSLLVAPVHHLTYPGFDWVRPLPAPWAHLHILVVAGAAVAVAAGWRTKPALVVYLLGFVWLELIDAALYLNHYWLMTVLGALLLALPVGRRWALDVRQGRVPRSDGVPAWVLWAARSQLAVVYVFAGLGKVNADWLIHGQPLGLWLGARTDRMLIGSWLDDRWVAMALSYAGVFFDLTIVGWLLWRRSRPAAYAAVVCFHVATAALFQIGLFPWMMIAFTPVFFAPDWPERFRRPAPRVSPSQPARIRPAARAAVGALVLVNVLVPLRHFAYAGDAGRNEAEYYGSFRVMLTERTGIVDFLLSDPATGATWTVEPDEVFQPWQVTQLATRPDLLVTAARILAREARNEGHERVEVRADAWVSVNGRPRHRLVEPTVDLATAPRRLR
jgi:hypothetical protein